MSLSNVSKLNMDPLAVNTPATKPMAILREFRGKAHCFGGTSDGQAEPSCGTAVAVRSRTAAHLSFTRSGNNPQGDMPMAIFNKETSYFYGGLLMQPA